MGEERRASGQRSASPPPPGGEKRERGEDQHEAEDVEKYRQERRIGRRLRRSGASIRVFRQCAPWCASHRSASIAALQPSPAADTACRYVGSATSPAAKTPSTD